MTSSPFNASPSNPENLALVEGLISQTEQLVDEMIDGFNVDVYAANLREKAEGFVSDPSTVPTDLGDVQQLFSPSVDSLCSDEQIESMRDLAKRTEVLSTSDYRYYMTRQQLVFSRVVQAVSMKLMMSRSYQEAVAAIMESLPMEDILRQQAETKFPDKLDDSESDDESDDR